MKELKCSDMGITSCGFKATGDNEKEVVDKMMEHAKKAHMNEVKKMSEGKTEAEVREMMREKIKDV